MTPFPVVRQPARPLAFDRLALQLGLPCSDDFTIARQLLALLEAAAPSMSATDRLQLSRIMSATAHAITLSCDKRI
jgi:hypothetical protein